jgi:RNA polymerase sigma-70 factor, ECF subfamily
VRSSAIADLSPAYRAAFLLREADGLAYEEIARALEIEVGSVRSRLARARAQLQEALADLRPEGRSP